MAASALDDPSKLKAFHFTSPDPVQPKMMTWLARTDRMFCTVQTISKGGENNLHSHTHHDGFWFVLRGRARFYSGLTDVFAEVGPHEGVLVPRGVQYWFESVGEETLDILQIECADRAYGSKEESMADRIDLAARKRKTEGEYHGEAKVLRK